jgi:DNA helicase HerA-like ATPase
LKELLGIESAGQQDQQDQIIVIDMNVVDDEVVELVSAVIARMVFRLLRRAQPRNAFPVHFVLEEAHRYIAEKPSRYAVEASRIFERIAKEGRKYGTFLMVASQRPSELSRTVLSQCSNFVVHRIQNPEDLSHIRQMTPFISEAVLRRLPSLPKQHALVFGNAVNLPTTFKVRSADPVPASHDTKIRELWFRDDRFPKILPTDAANTGTNVTAIPPRAAGAG